MSDFSSSLQRVFDLIAERHDNIDTVETTAAPECILHALRDLPRDLPEGSSSLSEVTDLLLQTICPALAQGQAGPRYYGFVTGGVTDSALLGDLVTSSFDTNQGVNLPGETIANYIEQIALKQTLSLLGLSPEAFAARTITSGATASNVLGLAVGREYVAKQITGDPDFSLANEGFASIRVKVLAAGAHASTIKAASIVGIGRKNVIDLTDRESKDQPCAFDLVSLEKHLERCREDGVGAIVVSSCGEVNTGGITCHFAQIRRLCDTFGAWLHIDAAFGAFAALHPDFSFVSEMLATADSFTSDCHKWLNLNYDGGLFFAKSLSLLLDVCGPGRGKPMPAYLNPLAGNLKTGDDEKLGHLWQESCSLASPMNMNLENSRRFRALGLYTSLQQLGRSGYAHIFQSNIDFARKVAKWIESSEDWELLLPAQDQGPPDGFQIMNIVLFAPTVKATAGQEIDAGALVQRINATRRIYVSPSFWRGRACIRLAVSNWRTREGHLRDVTEVLSGVVQ